MKSTGTGNCARGNLHERWIPSMFAVLADPSPLIVHTPSHMGSKCPRQGIRAVLKARGHTEAHLPDLQVSGEDIEVDWSNLGKEQGARCTVRAVGKERV